MTTDYIAHTEYHYHEAELVEQVERRRIAAERAVKRFDGDRLALIAHLARTARATRAVAARPASC
jgi:hypothetical protein